jgi:hypothetical protein
MPGSRPARTLSPAAFLAVLFVLALAAAACGGSDGGDGGSAGGGSAFPAVDGRSLEEIAADIGVDGEIVASPAGQVFREGRNRFGFGLFTVAKEPIEDADAAIYVAHRESPQARGPFPARIERLATDPAFAAKTTTGDPDAVGVVYVTELELPREGEWRLLAVVRDGDDLGTTRMPSIVAGKFDGVPARGERPPRIHTPTAEDVADTSQIDTRMPHSTMHEVDFADVLGKRPVVLLFATPALCQSRVCGPVVDVAEQVKSEYWDEDVAFIYMEVYRDNDPSKGLRPQLKAFNLPSEPWLFVVDASGRVSTAIEGGFSVKELRRAVEKVVDV